MRLFGLLHPAVALVYFAGAGVCLLTFQELPRLALAVAGLLAMAFFFAGKYETGKILKWMLPMDALVILLGPLFNHRGRTVLFYLWGNSFTLEAVLLGINQALLLAGLVLLFVSFNKVIPPPAFLYLTGKHMPRTALLINLALQAGARLARRAGDMLDVQRTRENAFPNALPKRQLALQLLNAFTVRSLEEGMEMAGVLKARDYGTAKRTYYRKYLFRKRDGLALILMLVLLALIFVNVPPVYLYLGIFFFFPLVMEGFLLILTARL